MSGFTGQCETLVLMSRVEKVDHVQLNQNMNPYCVLGVENMKTTKKALCPKELLSNRLV